MPRSVPRLPVVVLLLLLVSGVAGAQANPKPAPRIAFAGDAVVASGMTPGKKVAWLAVERRVDADYTNEVLQLFRMTDAAADGTVRIEWARGVAPRGLWVAVDVESGESVVAVPEGYRVVRPQRPSRLGVGEGTKPDEILDDRPVVLGLMVRPGEGAWAFGGGDGSSSDEDGVSNGHIRFALDRLEPLPGSPAAPAKSKGTDLWFVIDPQAMEISVHKGGVAQ